MTLKLNLAARGMLVVGALLLMEVLLLVSFTFLLDQAERERQIVERAKSLIVEETSLSRLVYDAGLSLAAYKITHSKMYGEKYDNALEELPERIAAVKTLASADPLEEEDVREYLKKADRAVHLLRMCKYAADNDDSVRGLTLFVKGDMRMAIDNLFNCATETVAKHKFNADSSTGEFEHTKEQLKMVITIAFLANIIVAVVVALLFTKFITKRLKTLNDNTKRLALGSQLNPTLSGDDEIAEVDRSFHKMAGELAEATKMVQASESRLRTTFERMPVGLITVDSLGIVQSSNPKAREIFKCPTDEGLSGATLSNLFPSFEKGWLTEGGDKVTDRSVELTGIRQDGEQFSAELSVNEFLTTEGRQLLANIQDVTSRHELDRLKQEFVAMISHDLRTPLTAVQLTLAMLLQGYYGDLNEQGKQRVARVEESTQRLIGLIGQLLDVEKLKAGKMELAIRRTKVSMVAQASLESLRAFAETHEVDVRVEPTDLVVMADGDRIIQVLVNLMSNAIKFSPQGGIVNVSAVPIEEQVEIRISDQGRGIPPDLQESIFERFRQVDRTDATERKGAGLGLTICKAIVEAHQGSIGVRSEVGQGSTFWFRIKSASQTA